MVSFQVALLRHNRVSGVMNLKCQENLHLPVELSHVLNLKLKISEKFLETDIFLHAQKNLSSNVKCHDIWPALLQLKLVYIKYNIVYYRKQLKNCLRL